jgi:hypothetical protein
MTPNSLAATPLLLTEHAFATHNSSFTARNLMLHRQRTEIIKLPLSNPPDEKKIRELNELAASYPFCILYRPKKYETL